MSDPVDKYLEQVLAFKAKKDLHADFLDQEQRELLLKELTLSLGFSQSSWEEAKRQAHFHFSVFKHLKAQYGLSFSLQGKYKSMKEENLLKAIALDPFNEKYLHTYVVDHQRDWKPKRELSARYLMLQKPGSTEFVDSQVDLAIRPDELDYDYFDAKILGPYIDNLIFLEAHPHVDQGETTSEDLKQMAESAGIDKSTLKELDKEVDDMREIVEKTMDNHWMTWADLHKASLVVDRMVELAPFRPSILFCAIQFYGKALWGACLAPNEVKSKSTEDKKAFYVLIFNKAHPSTSLKVAKAEESIAKAKELAMAFEKLPKKLFEKQDNRGISAIDLEISRIKFRFRNEVNPESVKSFIRTQELLLEAFKEKVQFMSSNNRFMFISGAILVLGYIIFIWTQTEDFELLVNFSILPVLAAVGLGSIRRTWWMNKKKTSNL